MQNSKIRLIIHFCISIFTLYVIYLRFIRYLLADNESIAVAMLNPTQLPTGHPILFSLLMSLILFSLFLLMRVKPSSGMIFRFMKGLANFSAVLLVLQLIIVIGQKHFPDSLNEAQFESKNLFVEVLADKTNVRAEPSLESEVVARFDKGTLLLLNDVRKTEQHSWNRVLLAPKQYGWIVRVAKVSDTNRKRLSKTNKFYFAYADQYSFLLAFIGFIWGFIVYKKQ